MQTKRHKQQTQTGKENKTRIIKRDDKLLKSLITGCIDQNLKFILWLQKSAVTENIGQRTSIKKTFFFSFFLFIVQIWAYCTFLVKEVGLKDISGVVVNVVEVMEVVEVGYGGMYVVLALVLVFFMVVRVGSDGGGDCVLGYGSWLWV